MIETIKGEVPDICHEAMCSASVYYPNAHSWFSDKFLPEWRLGKREIIVCRDEDNDGAICGVTLVRCFGSKPKICTIYIKPEYRDTMRGSTLIQEVTSWLGGTAYASVPLVDGEPVVSIFHYTGFVNSGEPRKINGGDGYEQCLFFSREEM